MHQIGPPFAGGPGYIGPQTDESWDYALKVSKVFGNHGDIDFSVTTTGASTSPMLR